VKLFLLFATSVIDTSGKFPAGVFDTSSKYATNVIDTCGKFGAGVVVTGGKFATGINNTVVLLASLPPVSLIRMSIFHRCS
jgi:hypothetical protein